MTLVDGPGFTDIEESGENNSIICLELGVQDESSTFPDTFPASAKRDTCIGNSVVYINAYVCFLSERAT